MKKLTIYKFTNLIKQLNSIQQNMQPLDSETTKYYFKLSKLFYPKIHVIYYSPCFKIQYDQSNNYLTLSTSSDHPINAYFLLEQNTLINIINKFQPTNQI